MKTHNLRRRSAKALIILAPLAMLVASGLVASSARSTGAGRQFVAGAERRARHSQLKAQLASPRADDARDALATLAAMDEPGALELWRVALETADAELKNEVWNQYRKVQAHLTRKELVPQVARVKSPSSEINQSATAAGLDAYVWSEENGETVVAAPPYLIERLSREGHIIEVLYDSIAEWQAARARGDATAQKLTPDYQQHSNQTAQVRIAVIDLSKKSEPARGYTDFLGDRENIIMRDGSLIAYLDIFESDNSAQSIRSRIEEQYAKRGYTVEGFYTPEEFRKAVTRFFPGKSFKAGRAKTERAGDIKIALEEGRFHSYEETLAEFKALASARPDIAHYVKIGTSFEGREIFALKISRNAAADDPNKPDVLIMGCHHAREWISVEPPVYFANRLVKDYDSDGFLKSLVDRLQIWIVPIVNPDGLSYSQGSPNDSMDPVRLWRKNRRPINLSGCASGVGVDLNRNYGFQWRLRGDNPCSNYCDSNKSCISDDNGASDDPANAEIYRGPQEESEPETKAIKSLIDDPNRRFRAHLDYHNFSQLILYPWGYQRQPAPDSVVLSKLTNQMSDAIEGVNGRVYRPQQAIDLYITTGTSTDYAHGANKVAVPLVIEMRPTCCEFNIPESEIDAINEENWAGAKVILNWAIGPPVLESVKVYSVGTDNAFSKQVYSARWVDPTDPLSSTRQLVVETRFPGIEQGPLQVRLQFSKPMSTALDPRVSLGRDTRLDELRFVASGGGGWQTTVYNNDTWVGETVIIQDENKTSAWRLAVLASDIAGFALDAKPETIAGYATGTGKWKDYEDQLGLGSDGGLDTIHALAPTLQGDVPTVFLASPIGGERLSGGEPLDIAWTVPKQPGLAPIDQAVLLSSDGGATYERVAELLPGNAENHTLVLPTMPTTRARVRIVSALDAFGTILHGDSQADFTIGVNVTGGVEISFISSEKVSGDWIDTSDSFSTAASGGNRLVVNVQIANTGATAIANPFLRVGELTRGNVLLTRDPKSPQIIGARQTFDAGSDNVLSPGEVVQARLIVGLVSKKKFVLGLQMYGVPVDGNIIPGSPFYVYTGKPKTR